MDINLQKWGNSQGIRIPKNILEVLNWKENKKLNLKIEKSEIVIRKLHKRKTIYELFENADDEMVCEPFEWGESVGYEI